MSYFLYDIFYDFLHSYTNFAGFLATYIHNIQGGSEKSIVSFQRVITSVILVINLNKSKCIFMLNMI